MEKSIKLWQKELEKEAKPKRRTKAPVKDQEVTKKAPWRTRESSSKGKGPYQQEEHKKSGRP